MDETVVLPRQVEPIKESEPVAAGDAARSASSPQRGVPRPRQPGEPQGPDGGDEAGTGSGGRELDETVVIPRQVEPIAESGPKTSAWDSPDVARGVAPVEGSPYGRARALGTVAWIFSAVITASLALVRLNWASMRSHELSAWGFTDTPWRLVSRLVRDTDPGDVPYFLLLKAWAVAFGRSDFALRVPSVIIMAATVGLLSIIATRLAGPRAGALAGLLMAVVPVTSRYAQEAGPQALTLFGATLATLALVALFDRPTAWRVVGYAAAVGLMGLSHVTGLLVVLAHLLVVLAMKRRVLPKWLLATLLGAAPTIALLILTDARPWRSLGDPAAVHAPSLSQLAGDTFGAVIVAGALVGFGLLALSGGKPGAVFTMWAVLPLILVYPVVHYTTFAPEQVAILAVPGWVGLAGLGLNRFAVMRGVLAVLLVAAVGIPTQLAIRAADGHGQASHQLADLLYTEGKQGDAIVYGPTDGDGPAGRDVVDRYLTAAHRPKDILAQSTPRANGHLLTPECSNVDACLGTTGRIWLVRVGSYDSPLTGLEAGKDGALRVRYVAAQSWNLTGLSLTLYTLKPNA